MNGGDRGGALVEHTSGAVCRRGDRDRPDRPGQREPGGRIRRWSDD